jgi:two-component system, CitB family, sensor kinase
MGRGVGLALVAQAVHRLGGAISVVNEVGAVFTVQLPRRGTPLPPDRQGVAASGDAARVAVDVPVPARSP